MCSGGGGGYSPPPDRSVELEQMRQAEAQRARDAEAARVAAERAQQESDFTTNLDAAYTGAYGRTMDTVRSRGLDPTDLDSMITAALQQTKTSIPKLDPNPGSYFSPTIADTILNNIQSDRRSAAGNQVSQVFTPTFATTALPDNFDDSYWTEALNGQVNDTMAALTRARARGTLDDTGLSAAQGRLNTEKAAATSKASQLGDAVIGGARTKLTNIADEARGAASSYTLGAPQFDVNPFKSRYEQTLQSTKDSIPGEIADVIGGNQFFDIGKIINAGGQAQGAQNSSGSAPIAEVLAQRERDRSATRGVGGTGQF